MNPVVARLDQPTPAELADVAKVFDQYRHHYGEPLMAGQALAWLAQHTRSGMLTIFTAHMDADLAGIATTLIVPARLPVAMAKAPADGELTAACDPAAQLGLQCPSLRQP